MNDDGVQAVAKAAGFLWMALDETTDTDMGQLLASARKAGASPGELKVLEHLRDQGAITREQINGCADEHPPELPLHEAIDALISASDQWTSRALHEANDYEPAPGEATEYIGAWMLLFERREIEDPGKASVLTMYDSRSTKTTMRGLVEYAGDMLAD